MPAVSQYFGRYFQCLLSILDNLALNMPDYDYGCELVVNFGIYNITNLVCIRMELHLSFHLWRKRIR